MLLILGKSRRGAIGLIGSLIFAADIVSTLPPITTRLCERQAPDKVIVERRYLMRGLVVGTFHCFDDDKNATPTRGDMRDAISKLIEDTIDSDSWIENHGRVGLIRWEGDSIVVTQTATNHRKLARLLEQLAATRAVPLVVFADRETLK